MRSPNEPIARPPRSSATPWLVAIAIGIAVVIGVGLFGGFINNHKPADPPAVLTSPAPATGVPAPAETTTGQPIPRPKAQ
jgi:hypothetical protein